MLMRSPVMFFIFLIEYLKQIQFNFKIENTIVQIRRNSHFPKVFYDDLFLGNATNHCNFFIRSTRFNSTKISILLFETSITALFII